MNRPTAAGFGALVVLPALLAICPAFAQAPQATAVAQDKAAPAKKVAEPGGNAETQAGKPQPKGEEKPTKAQADPGKANEKQREPTVKAVQRDEQDETKLKDRLQRRKHQQDIEHAKIATALRGLPMTEAMNQELKRHARRLARLERIKALALEARDTAVVERVNKLIEKENARHDKFITHVDGKDDRGKDDRGKDDRGKDDRGKDDRGKDDRGGVQ